MNNQRTVLHVDDDVNTTRVVSEWLGERGYQVISINDPTEALDTLIRRECRVVLLDIDMPQKNGLELLDDIKRYDGGIQAIMLAGVVEMSTVLSALRGGAEACFFKPIEDIEPLIDALQSAFHKIDRWWSSLGDLMNRKKTNTQAHVPQVTEPEFAP